MTKQTYPVHVRLVFVAPRSAASSRLEEKREQKPGERSASPRSYRRRGPVGSAASTVPACPAAAFETTGAQPRQPPQLCSAIFPCACEEKGEGHRRPLQAHSGTVCFKSYFFLLANISILFKMSLNKTFPGSCIVFFIN